MYSFIAFLGLSCSRDEHFKTYFNQNTISIDNTGYYDEQKSILTDTLKVSKNLYYKKSIYLTSTDGIKEIILSNGTSKEFLPINKTLNIAILTKGVDNFTEVYTITIRYLNELEKTITINLYTFKNMLPIADINFDSNTNQLYFNKSYDLDKRYGGDIAIYQLTINNVIRKKDTISSYLMTDINSIVKGKTYNVKLDVIDNDNADVSIEKNITL